MSCSVRACAFPDIREGLCAIHLRDRSAGNFVQKLGMSVFNPNVGDRIKHASFGVGIVRAIREDGNDNKISIDFENGGTKVLSERLVESMRAGEIVERAPTSQVRPVRVTLHPVASGPNKRKTIDWDAAQRDRNSKDLTLNEIAEKYGVSVATVCNHTKAAPDSQTAASKSKPQPLRQGVRFTLSELRELLEKEKAEIEEQLRALDVVVQISDRFRVRG